MLRLVGIAAFAMLLLLVVCGAGPDQAQAHDPQLDRLQVPAAIPSATALGLVSPGTLASIIRVTPAYQPQRLRVALPESILLQDPLTVSSVLRV